MYRVNLKSKVIHVADEKEFGDDGWWIDANYGPFYSLRRGMDGTPAIYAMSEHSARFAGLGLLGFDFIAMLRAAIPLMNCTPTCFSLSSSQCECGAEKQRRSAELLLQRAKAWTDDSDVWERFKSEIADQRSG